MVFPVKHDVYANVLLCYQEISICLSAMIRGSDLSPATNRRKPLFISTSFWI